MEAKEEYISIKDFAMITKRFTNQIYDLINKGNQYGKLKSKKIDGKIRVLASEADNFPFNSAVKVKLQLEKRIVELENKIEKLKKGDI